MFDSHHCPTHQLTHQSWTWTSGAKTGSVKGLKSKGRWLQHQCDASQTVSRLMQVFNISFFSLFNHERNFCWIVTSCFLVAGVMMTLLKIHSQSFVSHQLALSNCSNCIIVMVIFWEGTFPLNGHFKYTVFD